jgi:zinc transporter
MAEKGRRIPSPVLLLETMVGYVVAAMAATGQRLSDYQRAWAHDEVQAPGRIGLGTWPGEVGHHAADITARTPPARWPRKAGGFPRRCCSWRRWSATWSPPWRRPVEHRREAEQLTVQAHGAPADRAQAPSVVAHPFVAARLAQRLDALDRDVTALAERARLLQEEVGARVAEYEQEPAGVLGEGQALHVHAEQACDEGRRQEQSQRLDALDRDVTALAERARLLQEEVGARVAEESNRQRVRTGTRGGPRRRAGPSRSCRTGL